MVYNSGGDRMVGTLPFAKCDIRRATNNHRQLSGKMLRNNKTLGYWEARKERFPTINCEMRGSSKREQKHEGRLHMNACKLTT
jgi:hypothetical protein